MISALEILAPAAAPAVDPAQAAAHLRLDVADPSLDLYIGAATAWAESYLGRALITQRLRWTVSASPPPPSWPVVGVSLSLLVLPQWVSPDMLARQSPLALPRQPVASVDHVAVGRWGGGETELPASAWAASLPQAQLRLRGPGFPLDADGYLAVDFAAGYGDTADAVPIAIRHAVLVLAASYYEHRGDDASDVVPPAVKALLSPFRLVSFG